MKITSNNKVTNKNKKKTLLQVGDKTVESEQEIIGLFSGQFDFDSAPVSSDRDGVKLVQYKSRAVKIKRPYGSISGLILFIIFTNSSFKFIENKFSNVKLVIFADNTNALISAENLVLKANEVFSAFEHWFKSLIINKTNVLLLQITPKSQKRIDIRMSNEIIPTVGSVTLLGVCIDSYLNGKKN